MKSLAYQFVICHCWWISGMGDRHRSRRFHYPKNQPFTAIEGAPKNQEKNANSCKW